jgi:hypothetical protein
MEAGNFSLITSLGRDLFYLSAVLIGFALGFLLHSFRRMLKIRSRNRMFTTALFIFTAAVLALAFASIVSKLNVFFALPVYIAAGILLVLSVLAVRFPRAAGFPLILLGGLLSVWIAYTFLLFPLLNAEAPALVSITNDSGELFIRFPQKQSGRAVIGAEGIQQKQMAIEIGGEAVPLDIGLKYIYTDTVIPIIGGQKRGIISAIKKNGSLVFSENSMEGSFFKQWYAFFSREAVSEYCDISLYDSEIQAETSNLIPGTILSVYFDGENFSFKTSR